MYGIRQTRVRHMPDTFHVFNLGLVCLCVRWVAHGVARWLSCEVGLGKMPVRKFPPLVMHGYSAAIGDTQATQHVAT